MKFENRFLKLETLQIETIDQEIYSDISTHYYNQSQLVGILNNYNTDDEILIPISCEPNHIQLFVRKYGDFSINYGSISFDSTCFNEIDNGVYKQWFSLFDESENDLFYGKIGVDDTKTPRILIQFTIEEENHPQENFGILKENTQILNLSPNINLSKIETKSKPLKEQSSQKKTLNHNISTNLDSSSLLKVSQKDKKLDSVNPKQEFFNDENTYLLNDSLFTLEKSSSRMYGSISSNLYNVSLSEIANGGFISNREFVSVNKRTDLHIPCVLLEKNEDKDSLNSASSFNSSRLEFNTLKAYKKLTNYILIIPNPYLSIYREYENEIGVLNEKLLEANEIAQNAKNLKEAIVTKEHDININIEQYYPYSPFKQKTLIQINNNDNFRYHQRLQEYQNACKVLCDENLMLKLKINHLQQKITNNLLSDRDDDRALLQEQIHQTQKLPKIQFEKTHNQKMVIEDLENDCTDMDCPKKSAKILPTSEIDQNQPSIERYKEALDKHKQVNKLIDTLTYSAIDHQVIIENNRLQEELQANQAKYIYDMSALQKEIEAYQKQANALENEKIELATELSLVNQNCSLLQDQINNQNEALEELKQEFQKSKQSRDFELLELSDDLKQTRKEKNNLEHQILTLQSEIILFIEERNRWRELDFPSQLAKAESTIKTEQEKNLKLQEELKKVRELCLNQIDMSLLNYDFATHRSSRFESEEGLFKHEKLDNLTDLRVKALQHELYVKSKTLDELTHLNNELKLKLNASLSSEKKHINDAIFIQIEELKKRNNALETEKEALKNELTKINENYLKLANKYMELTDISVTQKIHKPPLSHNHHATAPPMRNSISNHAINARDDSQEHNSEDVDSILQEFLAQNKLATNLFIKIDKATYLFNSKKINFKLLHGKLSVRVGGGCMSLVDFLRNNKILEPKVISERRSVSPVVVENDSNEKGPRLSISSELTTEKNLSSSLNLSNNNNNQHMRNQTPSIPRGSLLKANVDNKGDIEDKLSKSMTMNTNHKISSEKNIENTKEIQKRNSINLISKYISGKKPNALGGSNTLNISNTGNIQIFKQKTIRDISPIFSKKRTKSIAYSVNNNNTSNNNNKAI